MHRRPDMVFCPLVGRPIPFGAWANLDGYCASLQAWQEKVRLKLRNTRHSTHSPIKLPAIIEEHEEPIAAFMSEDAPHHPRNQVSQPVVKQATDVIIDAWLNDKYTELAATKCALHVLGPDHESNSINRSTPSTLSSRLLVVNPASWIFDLCDMGNDVWACILIHPPDTTGHTHSTSWNQLAD